MAIKDVIITFRINEAKLNDIWALRKSNKESCSVLMRRIIDYFITSQSTSPIQFTPNPSPSFINLHKDTQPVNTNRMEG